MAGHMKGIFSRLRFPASCLFVLVLISLAADKTACPGGVVAWKAADQGISVAEIESSSSGAQFALTVVKIDPKIYSFRLLCASEYGKEKLTAKEWATRHHLVAAVNAGMFQEDGLTSVGFMKNFGHVNNPRLNKSNTVLAFNPVDDKTPEVQIIDRECQDFNELRPKYSSFVQSIRMISCDNQNVWSQQNAKWSTLALGTDTEGNILFIFGRTPQSVHDFVEILLSLPLSLKTTMYLEGGPQASIYLSTPNMTLERNGTWEGFEEGAAFQFALPVPNVIGITKKEGARS